MKEPIFKEHYQTGFYFFWKWQYMLRHYYLIYTKGLQPEKRPNVDLYLISIRSQEPEHYPLPSEKNGFADENALLADILTKKDRRYIKTSDEILTDYYNGQLSFEDLLINVPKNYRRGYHLVKFEYKDNVLTMTVDTTKVDVMRQKKGILDEISGKLDIVGEHENFEGEGIVPERTISVGHEKYWRQAASKKVSKLKVNFLVRATGLWLWDYNANSRRLSQEGINNMLYKFPDLEKEDSKADLWQDKYRKRAKLTHRCIEEIEVLPI